MLGLCILDLSQDDLLCWGARPEGTSCLPQLDNNNMEQNFYFNILTEISKLPSQRSSLLSWASFTGAERSRSESRNIFLIMAVCSDSHQCVNVEYCSS